MSSLRPPQRDLYALIIEQLQEDGFAEEAGSLCKKLKEPLQNRRKAENTRLAEIYRKFKPLDSSEDSEGKQSRGSGSSDNAKLRDQQGPALQEVDLFKRPYDKGQEASTVSTQMPITSLAQTSVQDRQTDLPSLPLPQDGNLKLSGNRKLEHLASKFSGIQEGNLIERGVVTRVQVRRPASKLLYKRETAAVTSLQNDHIVRALQCCDGEGIILTPPYDLDLHTYLRQHWKDAASFSECDLALVRGIASALLFMTERGVVHRDVKVGNILIEPHAENAKAQYRAVLSGLGQSLLLDPRQEEFAEEDAKILASKDEAYIECGTLLYRAPETINHRKRAAFSEKSDKYSYGMVLYAFLRGREVQGRDFPENAPANDIEERVASDPKMRPMIPHGMSGMACKISEMMVLCWKHSPEERGTFKALIAALGIVQASFEASGQATTPQETSDMLTGRTSSDSFGVLPPQDDHPFITFTFPIMPGYVLQIFSTILGNGRSGVVFAGSVGPGDSEGEPVAVKSCARNAFDKEVKAMRDCQGSQHIIRLVGFLPLSRIILSPRYSGNLLNYFEQRKARPPCPEFDGIDCRLMQDVCAALRWLRYKEYVHRDVKLQNIFVTSLLLRAVLGDLELARQYSELKDVGFAGTLVYSAPETLTARPQYSKHSDTYSFGTVLFGVMKRQEVICTDLAGVFENTLPEGVRQLIIQGSRPELERFGWSLARRSVLEQCWNQKPEERSLRAVETLLEEEKAQFKEAMIRL